MNALNEVNKMVLASYGSSSYGRQYEEDETVGAETLVVRYRRERGLCFFLSKIPSPSVVDQEKRSFDYRLARQSSPASIRRETGENFAVHDSTEGVESGGFGCHLGRSGCYRNETYPLPVLRLL